jgi:hypothetical protein
MDAVVKEVLQGMLVPGLGALLLGAALSLAREYARRLRDERLRQVLLALVQAAEQIYGAGKGEAKRRYVREKMKEKGLPVSREDVEAAVYGLTQTAPQ